MCTLHEAAVSGVHRALALPLVFARPLSHSFACSLSLILSLLRSTLAAWPAGILNSLSLVSSTHSMVSATHSIRRCHCRSRRSRRHRRLQTVQSSEAQR